MLEDSDVASLLASTPRQRRGGHELFRKLDDQGLITYTEYLFLLSVLTSE